jgi:hypothetical protein
VLCAEVTSYFCVNRRFHVFKSDHYSFRSESIYTLECLLTVDCRIKVRLDLQADKSPIVVKGPKVSNPWNNVQRKDSI